MLINGLIRRIWLISAFILLISNKQSWSQFEDSMLEADRLRSGLDDPISHVDYLITIYSSTASKPCSYFSHDRYSQAESSLINCTWYKSNACCKRTEVASVFLTMFTLNTENKMCMNLMNYMMCFFCSPEQYIWYRKSQVSICLKFCEDIYEQCKSAEFGGRLLGEIYNNGRSFCQAQDFDIVDSNYQCFAFDPSPFSRAAIISSSKSIYAILSLFFLHFLNR